MNHNDDKVKDLLENVEIPDEISPENMKKMLDEKAPAKKRSGISMAGRVTAAAVACAVLVGAAVGTSGLISRDRKGGEKCVQPVETEIPIETVMENPSPTLVSRILSRISNLDSTSLSR